MKPETKEILESACGMYCRWYDEGDPDWMSGETMAYELVSAIRQALANGGQSTEANCTCDPDHICDGNRGHYAVDCPENCPVHGRGERWEV